MKRNWTMRVAVLMAVLALVTSCFVGGTFAKYVAKDEVNATARVAKFGVVVTPSADKMFATEYEKHDTSFTLAANTVVSSNSDRLVAPGTNGKLAAFTFTGEPEVAVRVSFKVEDGDIELTNWRVEGDAYYCPLIVTVGTTELKGMDYTSEDEFAEAIKDAINALEKDVEANTDLSTIDLDEEITWEWPFETGANETEIAANDINDTFLGDKAAANLADAGTISLKITCAVTQID